MTIIGKILTVFIFLFSLVFLGFAITINQLNKDPKSGKSWYTLVQEQQKRIKDLGADLDTRTGETNELRARVHNLTTEMTRAQANHQEEKKQANDQIARATTEATTVKTRLADSQVALEAALLEAQRRREEVANLNDVIKRKDVQLTDMQGQVTTANNQRVQAEVARAALMDRLKSNEEYTKQVVTELEDLQQRLADASRGGSRQPGEMTPQRPPPSDVQGIIKQVDPNGLVAISIGSDAGLLKGHTLEVFRTSPRAEYIGRVTLIEVRPHESVGRMDSVGRKVVKENDTVARDILPKR
jgi:hypothetical protein